MSSLTSVQTQKLMSVCDHKLFIDGFLYAS